MKSEREFRESDVVLEIRIAAKRERVWEALVTETVDWWPRDYYIGTKPLGFKIDPTVGGRVFEDWGDGEGALWATVFAVKRYERLEWVGDLGPDFGGPARSISSFRLEEHGDETVVRFRDSAYGLLSEATVKSLDDGWRFLLDGSFKTWVEKGERPERPDSVS